MRPVLFSSLQYPTREVRFLWWTLNRSLTCNSKSLLFHLGLNFSWSQKKFVQVILRTMTRLCYKLLISLYWWVGKHLHSHLSIFINKAMVYCSKSTSSKNPLKVVGDLDKIIVCIVSLSGFQWWHIWIWTVCGIHLIVHTSQDSIV